MGDRSAAALSANVLDRRFAAPAPNRKWVADFTYIWTAEGWLYVAAVLDLFSRGVVGWSMSATMTAELVTNALVMAIWRRGRPKELLHHSDRGSPVYERSVIRSIVNDVLVSLDAVFEKLHEGTGRRSIAPEQLLRAPRYFRGSIRCAPSAS